MGKRIFSATNSVMRRGANKAVNNNVFSCVTPASEESPWISKVDLIWHLFHAWPTNSLRFYNSRRAAQRIDIRRDMQTYLPERNEFITTVAYFEAVMPVVLARRRFLSMFQKDNLLTGANRTFERIRKAIL